MFEANGFGGAGGSSNRQAPMPSGSPFQLGEGVKVNHRCGDRAMSHTAPNPVEGIAENSCVVATLFRSLFAQCRDMAALKLFEGYHRKGMAQHVWVHAQRYTDVGAPDVGLVEQTLPPRHRHWHSSFRQPERGGFQSAITGDV